MSFLGLGDLATPANTSIAGWSLLALMTLTQFFSTRQLNPGGTDQQRRMQMLLPFFFVFIMIRFPAALVLYWATQNLYQFTQQMVMLRGWNPSHWFTKHPPERAPKTKKPPPAPAPVPPPTPAPAAGPTQTFGSAVGAFGGLDARRDLSEKRKRRRRKKRKRRR
jgi:membrane protein insertase Oxa1/YidC/SpoIIIJ